MNISKVFQSLSSVKPSIYPQLARIGYDISAPNFDTHDLYTLVVVRILLHTGTPARAPRCGQAATGCFESDASAASIFGY